MTEANDAETVKRVLAGDTDAFRLIVDRHARALHRVAHRITGSSDDAEDVVQEALIRAFRQLSSYDRRAAVSTWLHRITVNCAVDLLRSRQRRKEDAEDEQSLMLHRTAVSQHEHSTRGPEIREAVARAMGSLSANERTAFMLRHFEGMSIDEIGRTLGTKVNATKHTVFRAVQKLRQELEPLVG